MVGERDQTSRPRRFGFVLGLVRMDAHRVPDVGMRLGDRLDRRSSDDSLSQMVTIRPTPAARARVDHRLAVGVELRRVQVHVAVDQHG